MLSRGIVARRRLQPLPVFLVVRTKSDANSTKKPPEPPVRRPVIGVKEKDDASPRKSWDDTIQYISRFFHGIKHRWRRGIVHLVSKDPTIVSEISRLQRPQKYESNLEKRHAKSLASVDIAREEYFKACEAQIRAMRKWSIAEADLREARMRIRFQEEAVNIGSGREIYSSPAVSRSTEDQVALKTNAHPTPDPSGLNKTTESDNQKPPSNKEKKSWQPTETRPNDIAPPSRNSRPVDARKAELGSATPIKGSLHTRLQALEATSKDVKLRKTGLGANSKEETTPPRPLPVPKPKPNSPVKKPMLLPWRPTSIAEIVNTVNSFTLLPESEAREASPFNRDDLTFLLDGSFNTTTSTLGYGVYVTSRALSAGYSFSSPIIEADHPSIAELLALMHGIEILKLNLPQILKSAQDASIDPPRRAMFISDNQDAINLLRGNLAWRNKGRTPLVLCMMRDALSEIRRIAPDLVIDIQWRPRKHVTPAHFLARKGKDRSLKEETKRKMIKHWVSQMASFAKGVEQ